MLHLHPTSRTLFGAALLAVGLAATPVLAQTQRAAPPAAAQALQQVQQLSAERNALQAENTRLKSEMEKLRSELQAAKGAQGSLEQRSRAAQATAERSSADVQRLEGDVARERERMQELVARFRETANDLREVEVDRNGLRQQLATRDTELAACVDRNAALYVLNDEVLGKLEDRGFWSTLAASEPFTRIKRNQLENLADEYRARAADQQLTSPATAAQR